MTATPWTNTVVEVQVPGVQGVPGTLNNAWAPATNYVTGQTALAPDGSWVKALSGHTSAAAFATDAATKWASVGSVAGTKAYDDLSATYAPLLGAAFGYGDRTLAFIGDSITAQGVSDNVFGNTTSEVATFIDNGWVGHATLRSAALWRFHSVRATSGYTPAQIRTTHLPGVITAAPWACVVLAGTNSEATTALSITELGLIYGELEAAGIHPILCTIPPRGQATYESDLNMWIRRYARDHGHVLVDFHTALVDSTTGALAAAYDSGDGIHPNAAGSALMGTTFATAMTAALGSRAYDLASDFAADSSLLIPNAVFTGSILGDTAPNGWVVQTALGTSTIVMASDAAIRGKKMTLTRNDSDVNVRTNHVTLVAGHRYALSFKIKIGNVGSGVSFRLEEATVGTQKLAAWTTLINAPTGWQTVNHEFTVPATGLTSYSWRFKVSVTGASGLVEIAEFTWMDLTARGVTA